MKTTSRIRITGIATIVIALLVVISAVGLTFAEEASQTAVEDTAQDAAEATPRAAVQETSQASVPNTSQAAVEEASQATVQETSEASVQIVPGASKSFDRGQRTPMVAKIASIINMSVEDLIAARHDGKSFMEIAAERGVGERQLLDALTRDLKTFLDTQVAQGKLTPEQAAVNLSKMEENLKIALSRTEVGPPETKPNTGLGIGRKSMSRMQPAQGRAMAGGKHGSMRGFSQGFQTGRKVGLRQGLGLGKGQGQGQGVCPFCGKACPFCGQTQEPAN
jgi:hypothetical protein